MKDLKDWSRKKYTSSCRVREHCRDRHCKWQITREGRDCDEELKICPVCGSDTDVTLWFGGLLVQYNRVKDNFVFMSPQDRFVKNHVDNADCPDTILFMLKHFKFDGWPEE